ncbi:unnamed protein product, partial [Owenia fusiformis]
SQFKECTKSHVIDMPPTEFNRTALDAWLEYVFKHNVSWDFIPEATYNVVSAGANSPKDSHNFYQVYGSPKSQNGGSDWQLYIYLFIMSILSVMGIIVGCVVFKFFVATSDQTGKQTEVIQDKEKQKYPHLERLSGEPNKARFNNYVTTDVCASAVKG